MTGAPFRTEVHVQNGVLIGPLRSPRNEARNVKGSIHDDATAQKLGLRGGTVAGSIHLDQFPPLLHKAFGDDWYHHGGVSMYFKNATTDQEQVRAFVALPEEGAVDIATHARMERDDGMLVAEGTASIGHPEEPSPLRTRIADVPPAQDIRILKDLEAEWVSESVPSRIDPAFQAEKIAAITEPSSWYSESTPFGGPIAPPSLMVHALWMAQVKALTRLKLSAVGLFGAIELNHLHGPVFVDHDYEARVKILAVGESPKTEYFWFESTLTEPKRAQPIANMLMMLRFMKASSPLWTN